MEIYEDIPTYRYLYVDLDRDKCRFTDLYGRMYDLDNYSTSFVDYIFYSEYKKKNVIGKKAIYKYFPLFTLLKGINAGETYFPLDRLYEIKKNDNYKYIYVIKDNMAYIANNVLDIRDNNLLSLYKYYYDNVLVHELNKRPDTVWNIDGWNASYI